MSIDGKCDEYPKWAKLNTPNYYGFDFWQTGFSMSDVFVYIAFDPEKRELVGCIPEAFVKVPDKKYHEVPNIFQVIMKTEGDPSLGIWDKRIQIGLDKSGMARVENGIAVDLPSNQISWGDDGVEFVLYEGDFGIPPGELSSLTLSQIERYYWDGNPNNINDDFLGTAVFSKALPVALLVGESAPNSITLADYFNIPDGWRAEIVDYPKVYRPADIKPGLDGNYYIFQREMLTDQGLVQRVGYFSPDLTELWHVDFPSVTWFLSDGPDGSALLTAGTKIVQILPDGTTQTYADALVSIDGSKKLLAPLDYSPEFGLLLKDSDGEGVYAFKDGKFSRLEDALDSEWIDDALWGPDGEPIVNYSYVGKIYYGSKLVYSSNERAFHGLVLDPRDETKLYFVQRDGIYVADLTKNAGSNITHLASDSFSCTMMAADATLLQYDEENHLNFITLGMQSAEIIRLDMVTDEIDILAEQALSYATAISPDGTINVMHPGCEEGYVKRIHPDGSVDRIGGFPKFMIEMKMDEDGNLYVVATEDKFKGSKPMELFVIDPDGKTTATYELPITFRADEISILNDGRLLFVYRNEPGYAKAMTLDLETGAFSYPGFRLPLPHVQHINMTNQQEDGFIYATLAGPEIPDERGITTQDRYFFRINPETWETEILFNFPYRYQASVFSFTEYHYGQNIGFIFTQQPIPMQYFNMRPDQFRSFLEMLSESSTAEIYQVPEGGVDFEYWDYVLGPFGPQDAHGFSSRCYDERRTCQVVSTGDVGVLLLEFPYP